MSSTLSPARRDELRRLTRGALVLGAAALAACVVGAFFDPRQFFRAYLAAYLFFLGIAHGCFALLMLYYLTGGAWGYLIRRILEAGMRTLPLLAVLFIPIACGARELYLWARPDLVAHSADLQHKQIYLNLPFWCVRAALCFALWVGWALALSYWSRRQDRTGEARAGRWLVQLSGPGLAVFGVSITFASVDWVMSLQPAFRSTIFGPLFASGEVLSGLACALVVLAWLLARPPLGPAMSLEALNDLGNLLFAFLIIWAYMGYFQFMLVWIADLPYDVIWYLPRDHGGWQWVALTVLVFQFAVPFFLLLMRDVKQNPVALAAVAGLVLSTHLVYVYYQVVPVLPGSSVAEHWMDFLTPVGLGGLWLASFLWQLGRWPLLAPHDENRASAVHLHALDEEEAARQEELRHA